MEEVVVEEAMLGEAMPIKGTYIMAKPLLESIAIIKEIISSNAIYKRNRNIKTLKKRIYTNLLLEYSLLLGLFLEDPTKDTIVVAALPTPKVTQVDI